MSMATIFLSLLSIVISAPVIKNKKVKLISIDELTLLIFSLVTTLLALSEAFVGIHDALIVGLNFVFIATQKSQFKLERYIFNSIVFILLIGGCYFLSNTIWLSISLISIALLDARKKSGVLAILGLLIMTLPLSDVGKLLYDQWGGFFILPAMLSLVVSEDSKEKFIYSALIVTVISSTKYISLGYAPVIILAVGLITFLGTSIRVDKKYVYSMAILPFIGISNPYNILAIYLTISVVFFFKTELLKIVEELEAENGSIKNIRYQDIVMLILGLYVLVGGPGSPLFWLIESASTGVILILILFIDILVVNQDCVIKAKEDRKERVTFKKPKEIFNVVFTLLIILVFKDTIFSFSYFTLITFLGFLIYLTLYKLKKNWLDVIFNIRNSLTISFTKEKLGLRVIEDQKKKKIKPSLMQVTIAGMDEPTIWSIFVFLVSVLLIARYL